MKCKKCGLEFDYRPHHFRMYCGFCLKGWILKMPFESELDHKVFNSSEDALKYADEILKRENWYEDGESIDLAIAMGYVGAYAIC